MYNKVNRAFRRLTDIFRLFPVRSMRLLRHILFLPHPPCMRDLSRKPVNKVALWVLDALLYMLEMFGVNEVVETLLDFAKPSTRPMNQAELLVLHDTFGPHINASRVVIDTTSRFAKRKNVAFVTWNTINHWGELPPNLIAHELTHIWQYQKFGGVYISKAIQAQHSHEGYNYGGETGLTDRDSFLAFNMEQQGDIMEDYYRHQSGLKMQWIATPSDTALEKLKKMTGEISV